MIDHAPKSSSVPVAPFATRQAKNLGTDPTGVGRRPLLAFSLPTEPASPASPAQPFTQEESPLHMALQVAAAQDAYTALPTPEGLVCYQPPGSRPSHPFGSFAVIAARSNFPSHLEGLGLWTGVGSQTAPSPLGGSSIEIGSKSRVSEGWTRMADLPYLL